MGYSDFKSAMKALFDDASGVMSISPQEMFKNLGRGGLNAFGPLGIFPHSQQGLTGDPEEYLRDHLQMQEQAWFDKYGS